MGIIGAGQIGGTLTRRLTALGHQVSVANSRGPETLADLAAETGAKPVSVAEAARSGEVPARGFLENHHYRARQAQRQTVYSRHANYSAGCF